MTQKIEFIKPTLVKRGLFNGFSKKWSGHKELVKNFIEGLKKNQDGKILKFHGL